MKLWLQAFLIAALAASAFAKDKPAKRPKPGAALKKVTKDIGAALGKGDMAAIDSAYARVLGLKDNFEAPKLAPVAKAIAKGATHKDIAIATKSIEMLGTLKVPGSGKLLGKLLAPAAKVKEGRAPLHVAAIQAARAIHDPGSVKAFDKLLTHADVDIATAAASAYAGYSALDPKPKRAFIKKLVATLAKLEKTRDAAADDRKATLTKVVAGLNESLAALTEQKFGTAAEWKKWIKERAKA